MQRTRVSLHEDRPLVDHSVRAVSSESPMARKLRRDGDMNVAVLGSLLTCLELSSSDQSVLRGDRQKKRLKTPCVGSPGIVFLVGMRERTRQTGRRIVAREERGTHFLLRTMSRYRTFELSLAEGSAGPSAGHPPAAYITSKNRPPRRTTLCKRLSVSSIYMRWGPLAGRTFFEVVCLLGPEACRGATDAQRTMPGGTYGADAPPSPEAGGGVAPGGGSPPGGTPRGGPPPGGGPPGPAPGGGPPGPALSLPPLPTSSRWRWGRLTRTRHRSASACSSIFLQ